MTIRTVKVWDIGVRAFHWLLVAFFFVSYLTGENESILHIYAGYIVLGLVVFRIVWGFIGTQYARFSDFVYGPRTTIEYLVSFIKGKPIHYIGHNPLGGWMTALLLIFLLLVTWSGLESYGAQGKGPLANKYIPIVTPAMADDDDGEHDNNNNGENEFWEEAHELLSNVTLVLVFVHILGVLISSAVHRENLIKAMITGNKNVTSE